MTFKSINVIALVALLAMPLMPVNAQTTQRYHVAACDWMMLKRQKLGEFALTRTIGADGVEMDMGPLGKRVLFDNQLRDEKQAAKFLHYADSLGVQVPSVAMSGFFAQNFVTRKNYKDLLDDCFTTMHKFRAKVAFLPLGGSGEGWKVKGADRDSLVSRLKTAGDMAEKEGVVIGIRTGLDAKESKKLLKAVGRKSVKIYYNFQDAADNNRDICKELRQLGAKNIIQIHASNTDSVLLKDDSEIDMKKVKATLDKMKWSGWLVIERSRDVKRVRDVKYNYGSNVRYLKDVFECNK